MVKLSRVNTVLLIAILLINGYIVILPVVPGLISWVQRRDKHQIQKLEAAIKAPSTKHQTEGSGDRLIIPSMVFNEPINQGPTIRTLRKGLWLRPKGSTPDKGSNTVIVGHRFTYSNPRGVLYNLNQVHVGDNIGVWWKGKHYLYQTTKVEVVGPNQISIEAPTDKSQLTIYTCTPLWLPKNRLVVIAKLEKTE